MSPNFSREKVDNSTGLTPRLGTAELHDALTAGGELFGDGMVVEGGSGGDTPSTQHPSLSLQGYNNQTPVDANNNLGDNDIDLGYDTVHQLESDFAGRTSAAHNDMVLQSPSISNQPLTGLPHPPQPPEEELPAVPSSSNNKERLIDALVTKASSLVVRKVINHPLVQYMLKQSEVTNDFASTDDLKQYYSNVRIHYLNNPNHFIETNASKLKRVVITNHGAVVDGIESFEKAQLARIVVLLVLIPSMGMKISKAKREYEKQRAQLAASLAIGIIGNAEDISNEDNNIFKTSGREGDYLIHMNYNGSQRTGTGIHFRCKSKEHAILVKKELCELLTDTDTSFIYLSGKQKGNICDLSVPVGQDSEDKVEYVKALAKERLINTGNFNDYNPDWLTPNWSNTQDNALKDFVLSGMIGENVSNELKVRQMGMHSRIYIGVDWEAASLFSDKLKGKTAGACKARWIKLLSNVPRDVPLILRPFYCARTDEGRRRMCQQKDAILNTILRDGIDDKQEVVTEEKEEEEMEVLLPAEEKEKEMEVLVPAQVKSGGDDELSNRYDDPTDHRYDEPTDPLVMGDTDTLEEQDMRKAEAVDLGEEEGQDLDKDLRGVFGVADNQDTEAIDIDSSIQSTIAQNAQHDTLPDFTIPSDFLPESNVPTKGENESAAKFYAGQLYNRIQNSESTTAPVFAGKEQSLEEVEMLFEADMQVYFNNDDKRKSNLYGAALGKTTVGYDWQNISSIVGTSPAYCEKYWKESIMASNKNNKNQGKLAKEADKVNALMRGALTKLLEEHVLIEKSAERESLIGKDVVIEQMLPSLPQEGGM